MTQGQHLDALRKMGAPIPKSSSVSEPGELEYLKTYWLQCRRDAVITYQELFYFQKIMQINLEPWEVEIIIQIDNIYWNFKYGNSITNTSSTESRG